MCVVQPTPPVTGIHSGVEGRMIVSPVVLCKMKLRMMITYGSNLRLYTCTHTFRFSFSLCGFLKFAACLSKLKARASGIPLFVSLTLSLSPSLFPACMRMPSHYSRARASTALPKRVASEVKHSARSWTIGDISADTKEEKQQ